MGIGEGNANVADRDGNDLHFFHISSRTETRVAYFSVFYWSLVSQSKSLHKSTTMMMMRLNFLRLKVFEFGKGVSGTPLAFMRLRAVPCLFMERASCISRGRIRTGMRKGAASDVHRVSWLYLVSLYTSVYLRRFVASS